ncbi:GntR family transcriptional regulator, partial [Actinomyces oris]
MIDRARTMADTKKSSTVNRASAPQVTVTADKETNITLTTDEPIIPHGPYSTLMSSPATQAEATMTEIKNYILRSGLQIGDALPTE